MVEDGNDSLPGGWSGHAAAGGPSGNALEAEQRVLAAYGEHGEALYRLALSECRNDALARDAVQEAFLRLLNQLAAGREVGAVRPWLGRVVTNILRDEERRSARDSQVASELQSRPAQAGPEEPSRLAERLTSLLTPRELQCVELRMMGYGYKEIAEALGVQSGTVARLLSRAMRKLESARTADL